MAARRRPSVRTRLNAEDVSSWVNHNTQQQQRQPCEPAEGEHHVRFNDPPTPSKSDSNSASLESLTESPVALDGGYGWVIVFASFVLHFVVDGESFCFGIIYLSIQAAYQANHVQSMFVAAMFLSLPLCASPFSGIASDLFGCRISIMLGGLICTISTIAAIHCDNFWWFTAFFGFGCGVGMSFIYNAAIVIVTYYFNKKRGLATSLAVSGTGNGTFAFPFYLNFAERLLKGYTTPLVACLWAYAFAYFIVFLIGVFIKDVSWTSDTLDYKEKIFEKIVKKREEDEYVPLIFEEGPRRRALSLPNLDRIKVDFGSIQSVCDAKADGKVEVPTRSKSVALFDNNKPRMPRIPEYSMINANLANLEHLDLELANSPCTTVRAQRRRVTSKVSMSVDQINELDEEDFHVSNLFHSSSSTESETESDSEMSNDGDSSSSELSEKKLLDPPTKIFDKTIPIITTRANSSAPTSARLRAPGTVNTAGGRILASNAIQSRFTSNLLTMGKIPSAPELVARKKRKSLLRKFTPTLLVNLLAQQKPAYKEVLTYKPFLFMMASVTCLYAVLDVPYVCFYDYGIEHLKLSEDMARAIYSGIGIANLLSTIIIGKLTDWCSHDKKPHLHKYPPMMYTFAMMMVGLSILFARFAGDGYQLLCCGVFFGVFVTSNYVLQSILITALFDQDLNLFQAAYSAVSLVEGLASFVGPILFAYIRETSGSYFTVFALSGVLAFFSAFFSFMAFRHLIMESPEKVAKEDTKTNGKVNDNNIDLESGEGFNHKYRQIVNGNGAENENLLHP
ncbi:hypothetical protein CAEBREN_09880 [Caenorhabditis brenneri]|uniref:Major facilitator superfamily (MFS) profile domain-containing protein n=1 Tax=Caenorhabditis brenneri TaxID=135651 RepID=G0MAN7_CAEBE|nr:hypothetical protein CAEBREN_09880 [Caenorhabditis brenneri]